VLRAQTYRQAKLHHAGNGDGMQGQWLDTFQIMDNITASIQICYDAYFPHMTMLPVKPIIPTELL
jgi:hypothetical protein